MNRNSSELEYGADPEVRPGDAGGPWVAVESVAEERASASAGDQDLVDEIGKAIGVTYADGEPLRVGQKEREHDLHRWELDPASAEDYNDRSEETTPLLKMGHVDVYARCQS